MPPLIVAIDARLLGSKNTGDTSYWQGLVHGLAQIDHDATVLLYTNDPEPHQVPDDPRFRLVHLPGPNRLWSLVHFPQAAKQAKANVVHTQYNISPLVKNGVVTVHDVSFFIEPGWFKPKDRVILRTQVPSSIKRAKQVITVSETSKHEIETYIPSAVGKTTVTYNALSPNFQATTPLQAQELIKTELGIDFPYCFTLGTRWPRKNLALAIQAIDALPPQLPHKLVITGQQGWGDLPHSPRVHMTGYVPDRVLPALYAAADLYLAPSHHEGFGIPLLEAFASHCPVICSPGGALPEVAATAALIAPDFEPTTWTNLIQTLLSNPAQGKTLIEKGQERLKDFSWATTAEKTLAVYQNAAVSQNA